MIEIGKWYRTQRGYLCRAELLHQDGSVTVISHYTGNAVCIDANKVPFLTETDSPETPPGTAMQLIREEKKDDYYSL